MRSPDAPTAEARERFLATGAHPGTVREDILSSWQRCLTLSVAPGSFDPPYRPDVNPEGRLLRAAGPVLDRITETSGRLGLGFVVTDDDARILARWADEPQVLRLLDSVRADRGHVFSEDTIGTNGLGTAVELGRTVRVDGSEHFADALRAFTCVGVPIHDPLGRRLLGVLDLTSAADRDNSLLTLLATQTAQQIERALFDQQSPREQALLQQFLAARRTTGGVVVVSDRLMLADPRAGRLLAGFSQPLLWERARRALTSSTVVEEDLPVSDGQTVRTTMRALRDGDEIIGVLMQVTDQAARRPRPAAHPDPRPAGSLPPELVGRSPGLRSAFRDGLAALSGQVVAICGEAGVGKLTLARALHDAGGFGRVAVHDAADIEAHGALPWFGELRGVLAGEAGTLVVRHTNLLPRSMRDAVAALLGTAVRHGHRCVLTDVRTHHGVPEPSTVLAGAVVVELPPLRERTDDLPVLMAALAPGRHIAPEVIQLLTRYPWPGNLRELTTMTHRMSAAHTRSAITLADVPTHVIATTARRPLSRFEQAELHTILAALTDADGNRTEAARLLGISRSTLYRRLRTSGLDLQNTAF